LQRELHLANNGLSQSIGCELRLGPELLLDSGNERMHTLNRSRYLLVELPPAEFPPYTEAVIFELQLRGLVPIVAHPERNAAIQDDPERYARLVERGVMGQLTARSLLATADRRTRQTAERLLKYGLVHVLASDAHDADERAPDLAQGLAAVARIVGRQQAEAMLYRIPEAIWSDRDLVGHLPQPATQAERSKQWKWLPIKLF
jgi:protein-tyrosine phosphatase